MNQKDDHGKTIDALNEMVGSGMKQLAISQPFASVQERKALLPVVEESCAKHHTNYYLEDRLLVSDLFPISFSEGRCVILFYRDEQVIRSYLNLKRVKAEALRRKEYFTVRVAIAYQFGALLSYPQQRIEEMIAENQERERYDEG